MFLKIVVCALLGVACLAGDVAARSTGAPREACINLKPKHGTTTIPQPSDTNPFVILAETQWQSNEAANPNEAIWVNITAKEDHPALAFRGFIVQARFANNPDIIVDGHFEPTDPKRTQTYTCKLSADFKHNNTWTHANNEPKVMVSALWTPPEDFNEEVVFMATIVKDKANYWEQQSSPPVVVGSLINMSDKDNQTESNKDNMVEAANNDNNNNNNNNITLFNVDNHVHAEPEPGTSLPTSASACPATLSTMSLLISMFVIMFI